ncbi:ATP-binding cassette domain-containing protein [Pengzhenrongella phosphoraccumulans]|uniref:ATP-binding cassette domain-containing protein n=1 Tax=Pengzhenrongella phosphoraccumulans TaxID=3114394 RepID=UPI00388FE8CE
MTHQLISEGVRFRYLRRGPAHISIDSLTLTSGVTFLVGPNGCGKSTLLKLFAGLLTADDGQITFDDDELLGSAKDINGARTATGYLRQDFTLGGRTTASAFLRYGAWMHGIGSAQLDERSRDLLAEAGLADRAATQVGRLSGGMQRRLGIAVEVSHDPVLLLLDEPTSGLDHDARERVHAVVDRLVGAGAIVVIASHEESEIARYDATVHVMRQGRITATTVHRRGDPVSLAVLLGETPQ